MARHIFRTMFTLMKADRSERRRFLRDLYLFLGWL
jgi:hypothetical protein